jgi:hypothetical protein
MNNSKILKFQDVDLNSLVFESPVKKKNLNGKSSYISRISINDNEFCFQSPKLKCIDFNKDTLKLQLELTDPDFKVFLHDLQSLVKNKLYENSYNWFNKSFSKEYISTSFNSSLDSETLSSCINDDLQIICDIPGDPFGYLENSNLILIFHLSGIWISQKHFGLHLRVSQLKVATEKFYIHDYSIVDDDSDFDYPSDIESEFSNTNLAIAPELCLLPDDSPDDFPAPDLMILM